ncbi:inositol-pentakisphosphate 2-kinase [Cadophora sp. MPI-SDFR-AT-0126]|nr:inositol-pentakisphosphate 2-kinase [Leotiomycetes sp. MPI-SDFR-AT-0126]
MTEPTIPVLPENAQLQYLGEGAANIVYRISIPQPQPSTPPPTELEEYSDGTPPPTEIEFGDDMGDTWVFENKLLRLRKDLPTTFPCLLAQSTWSRLIRPLFPSSQLVNQSLVSLHTDSYDHISALNTSLVAWERQPLSSTTTVTASTSKVSSNDAACEDEQEPKTTRPQKRHGVYLANDPHGLLVIDMSGLGVLQFKPKWLAQSPSAPVGARRCRQCALVARKAFLATSRQEKPQKAKSDAESAAAFCPLDLLSTDEEILREVTGSILGPDASSKEVQLFTNWLTKTSLLKRLRDVQLAMDKRGVLASETASEELRVAMTLRDCSVFVRLGEFVEGPGDSEGEGEEVEARIGDLDVKSPEKLAYWKETERVLVEEGWYAGREEGEDGRNTCSLGRG